MLRILGSVDPLVILKDWLGKAQKNKQLKNSWAMNLCTSDKGQPSARIVLFKYFRGDSLVFFSNYLSRKGQNLQNNAQGAATFYWENPGRQIRIEGKVKKIPRKESVAYWGTRSRESQLSQWLSQQSQPVLNRRTLDALKIEVKQRFKGGPVPCPSHWGGYALSIQRMEFWMEKNHRLHDRFLFKKRKGGWAIQRLFP
ncbi:MAG: pyridoxamine 5'-phosphate oxidase [Bdellovibrionales bacterium]|nr:pyridoxamine 5'-phosphate oxidase [Bdellovibrionales bacterium]